MFLETAKRSVAEQAPCNEVVHLNEGQLWDWELLFTYISKNTEGKSWADDGKKKEQEVNQRGEG